MKNSSISNPVLKRLEKLESDLLQRAKEIIRYNNQHQDDLRGLEFKDFVEVEKLRNEVRATQ